MFFRYFFVLSLIVLVALIIDTSEANPAVAVVTRIIAHLFKGAAQRCLHQAASECSGHSRHPKAAISCAKNFLKNNKGRCAVG